MIRNNCLYNISSLPVFAFFIILFAACNGSQQPDIEASADNVFSAIEYDKVIAYDNNGEGAIEIIDKHGQLAKEIKKQIELSNSQITRITNALCDKSSYGGDIAACFDPHFGIVYYKANLPVAFVSICLDCNYLVSSINIPHSDVGFSDEGIQKIVDFEKELNF